MYCILVLIKLTVIFQSLTDSETNKLATNLGLKNCTFDPEAQSLQMYDF